MHSTMEKIGFVVAVLALGLGLVIGIAELYSVSHPSGSGEWAGLGVALAWIVCIGAGLIGIALAFTQRSMTRRVSLILVSLCVLALPWAIDMTKQSTSKKRVKEIEEQIYKQLNIERSGKQAEEKSP
jgi:hypothetical protein